MTKGIAILSFVFLFFSSAFAQQNSSAEKVNNMGANSEDGSGKKYLAPGFTFSGMAGLSMGVLNGKYHLIVEDANFKYFEQTYPLLNALGYRVGVSAAFQSKFYGAEIPIIFSVDRFSVPAIDKKIGLSFMYMQVGLNNHIKFANENSFAILGFHFPLALYNINNVTTPIFFNIGYGQKFLKKKFGVDLCYQFNLNSQTSDGSNLISVSKTLGQDKNGNTVKSGDYSYGLLTLHLRYDIFTTRKEKTKKPKPDPQLKIIAKAEKEKAINDERLAKQKLAEQKHQERKLAEQKMNEERLANKKLADQKREEQRIASQRAVELRLAEIKLAEQKAAEQKVALIPEKKIEATDTVQMRGSGSPLKGINIDKAVKEIKVGKYYALIIGIDAYTGTWTKLKNGVNDAKAIEQLLKTKYKFEVFKTLYNEQATRSKIIEHLEWLVANVQPNDNVLIYYSGHGEFKKALNKGYWVPVDAASNSVSQFISNTDLQTFLGGIKSKHTLLMSDACFSGDIFRGNTVSIPFENSEKYYSKVYEQMSRQAISSGGIEPVMDGGKEGHSVFAYYVLKALNNNTDKYYDASQLFEKIKIPIINNSNQTPDFSSIKNTDDEGGHFIFIKK